MCTLVGEVGNWVSGKRFWGREKELAHLLELIGDGANISIIAQRRIGKTSLMREAGERLPTGYVGLYIDLQDAQDCADVVVKLTAATRAHADLWYKVKGCFSNVLHAVKDTIESISVSELEIQLRAGLSGGTWQEKGSQAFAELAGSDANIVLFIDELPILINRLIEKDTAAKHEVHILLSWLRAQAQEHKGRICMVLAGSIGLEPVLNRLGLSADVNHLTPFSLKPWDNDTAIGCLQALAAHRSLTLPVESCQRMLELLGCNIPHHVQMFFFQARAHCLHAMQDTLTPKDVDTVFHRRMLSSQGHTELTHMEYRLAAVLEKLELPLAEDLLTQAAVTGHVGRKHMAALAQRHGFIPEDSTAILKRLFEIFEHDGYLRPCGEGRYEFVSKLLEKWWKARFETFFEPV